jgi:hypothetical protein
MCDRYSLEKCRPTIWNYIISVRGEIVKQETIHWNSYRFYTIVDLVVSVGFSRFARDLHDGKLDLTCCLI